MKFFVNNGSEMKLDENKVLKLSNLEDFLTHMRGTLDQVPAPHASMELNYTLVVENNEFTGKMNFDTYKGIKNEIEEGSPYIVNFVDWKLGEDTEEKYLEFEILDK